MGQLFASGTDISGWGFGEWALVGVGALAGVSLLNNVASAGRSVRKAVRSSSSRARKKKRLQQELSEL
jgi:hypothetical protein